MGQEQEEEEDANLRSFLSWAATKLGISDSSSTTHQSGNSTPLRTCLGRTLFVSHFPEAGGRGLAAARDLEKGELILKVPKHALVTTESLMIEDQALSLALFRHHSHSSSQMLAVALLNEVSKGKCSRWYPYLKQIPCSYDTLASFRQLEIESLQIDDAIWAAERAVRKAESEWNGACPILSELKLKPKFCTFKAWLWASATISSRTMHVPWDDAGCLCPVGDFFNYASPGEEPCSSENLETCVEDPSSHYSPLAKENIHESGEELLETSSQRLIDAGYEKDGSAYCFYARRHYRKGEQVLLSYGTYTNLELLEHYGFLLNENPNDKVFILLEPDMYFLSSWPKESVFIHQDGSPSFALLSTLRLWAMPGTQRKLAGHLAYSGSRVSEENDVIAMKWLAEKCHSVLKALPTSIEEDESVLKIIEKMKIDEKQSSLDPELLVQLVTNGVVDKENSLKCLDSSRWRKSSYRLQLAVQWRLKYKRILVDCIKHCTQIIKTIDSL